MKRDAEYRLFCILKLIVICNIGILIEMNLKEISIMINFINDYLFSDSVFSSRFVLAMNICDISILIAIFIFVINSIIHLFTKIKLKQTIKIKQTIFQKMIFSGLIIFGFCNFAILHKHMISDKSIYIIFLLAIFISWIFLISEIILLYLSMRLLKLEKEKQKEINKINNVKKKFNELSDLLIKATKNSSKLNE